ncbi:hypothetical protein C8J57DRAFT_1221423 [Mycena rebaudengoi]|nr:hypothetical protein C8J57DRAFT_1221423 [Mycena rebaudengoi]
MATAAGQIFKNFPKSRLKEKTQTCGNVVCLNRLSLEGGGHANELSQFQYPGSNHDTSFFLPASSKGCAVLRFRIPLLWYLQASLDGRQFAAVFHSTSFGRALPASRGRRRERGSGGSGLRRRRSRVADRGSWKDECRLRARSGGRARTSVRGQAWQDGWRRRCTRNEAIERGGGRRSCGRTRMEAGARGRVYQRSYEEAKQDLLEDVQVSKEGGSQVWGECAGRGNGTADGHGRDAEVA